MFTRVPGHLQTSHRIALILFAIALTSTGCDGGVTAAPGGLATSTAPLASPPVAVSAECRTGVRQNVAQRLGVDPARIRGQIRADPNLSVMVLAKQAGLAQDQIAAVILTALNDCADAALRSATWTAQQASEEKRFWTAQSEPDRIEQVSRWFAED